MTTRFDRDTAARPLGDGRYAVRIDRGWWVMRGPNGGYVAALVLRALEAACGDPARAPRSLSVHYLEPPEEGEAHVETRVERRGRSLTCVSGSLIQAGRPVALARAKFSVARASPGFREVRMPEVAPPEQCPPMESRVPIHERYDQRWAVGSPPFSGGSEARCGGWIRLPEPRPLDALALAAFCDAFPPALFSRLAEPGLTGGVPTLDLHVHFRAGLAANAGRDDAFTLALFRSRMAHEGFVDEDGELWSADGELLAQSRQLALVT